MDTNIITAIIAVTGTLIVTIISYFVAYFIQNKTYTRERKRSIEDEDRKRQFEREAEQSKIKRELLSNRLNIVEEAVNLRMFLAGLTLREEFGDPIYCDKSTIQEKRKRLDEISSEAWTAVIATGSEELKESFSTISSAYWQSEEQGTVDSEKWDKASKSFVEIIKNIDDMKTKIQ